MAAVDPPVETTPSGTFARDLHQLADWFQPCGVTTIAMEPIGVYVSPLTRSLSALLLIPEEAAPLFRDNAAPRNGMMPPPRFRDDLAPQNGMIPPRSFTDWRAPPLA
jgi:hypothetical protein